jgi:uncharacterized membrane protein
MTRLEFAGLLRGELRGLDQGEIEKSAAFYDELISDHMDEGMTEEEAVAAVGTPAEIAGEILMDQPVTALVRRRVKRGRRLSALSVSLIALGSPVWLPLLVTAAVLALAFVLVAYVLVLVAAVCAWAVAVSCAAAVIVGLFNLSFSALGLLYAGAVLAGAGLAVLTGMGAVRVTRWCVIVWRGVARAIKKTALGRRGRNEK